MHHSVRALTAIAGLFVFGLVPKPLVAGETIGFWLFDGGNGAAVPVEFPNWQAGAPVQLRSATTSSAEKPAAIGAAFFTNDVPAKYLFTDAAHTIRYPLKRSVRLVSSSNRRTAHALQMAFGEAVKDDDFTIEWFVKSDVCTGAWVDGNLGSISKPDDVAHSPVWRWDAYVGGQGNVRTNGTDSTAWLGNPPNSRHTGNSAAWHQAAVIYNRATRCFRFYRDYRCVNSTAAESLSVAADSVFQISGTMDCATTAFLSQNVAAVRISRGALSPREFMVVNNQTEPRTLVHYRFDGPDGVILGTEGTSRVFRNTVFPLPAYDAWADPGKDDHPVGQFTRDRMTEWWRDETGKRRNVSAIDSATNGVPGLFKVNAYCPPEYLGGSFTAEIVIKANRVNMNVVPLFGQGTGSGTETGWCLYLFQGSPRVRHYMKGLSPCSTDQAPIYTAIPTNHWVHLAVTFDADTRTFRTHSFDGVTRRVSEPWIMPTNRPEIWKTDECAFAISSQGNFNSGAMGGLDGKIDEFRFSRGVLEPSEFLTPCHAPGTVLCIRGSTTTARPADTPPVPEAVMPTSLPAPVTAAPFVRSSYAVQEAVAREDRYSYQSWGQNDAGLYPRPIVACGNMSVTAGRNSSGTDQPGNLQIPGIYRERTLLAFFHFWGSNTNGYGYPFAAIEGDPDSSETDPVTGVVTYRKPYLDRYGERRVFTYTLTPVAAGRIELAWNTGTPTDDGKTYDGVGPWLTFKDAALQGSTIIIDDGASVYEPLYNTPGVTGTNAPSLTATKLLVTNASPDRTFSIAFSHPMKAAFRETRTRSGNYSNETHEIFWQLGNSGAYACRDKVVIDFGETGVLPKDVPQPVEETDFWSADATEFPMRPGRNLLANGSFEQGLRYYRYTPGGAKYVEVTPEKRRYVIITNDVISGRKALYCQSYQGYVAGIRTFPVPTEAGKQYTLSFYAKGDQNGRNLGMSLASAAHTGGQFPWYPAQSAPESQFTLTKEWKRYTRTFTADAGGVMIQIGGLHSIWIDDIQLEKGATATAFDADPVVGVLETSDPDDALVLGADPNARFVLHGEPGTCALVDFRLQNAFRETLWEETRTVTFDAAGDAVERLPFTKDFPGEGLFVLRTGYRVNGCPAWCDFHRFSVMTPLSNTHPTKNIFGTLLGDMARVCRGEDLAARFRAWGFGSSTWGTSYDMAPDRTFLKYYKKYGFNNFFRPINSENAVLSKYLTWTNVTEEMEALIEQVAYDTVRTNDQFFTVWAFGNEEESSPMPGSGQFDEYAKAQLACYRGVKRANPNALVMPTCGTSGYSLDRGYKAINGYLEAARRKGIFYDAVAVHQYGNIDKGSLSTWDMETETQRLIDRMTANGYPETTPIITTETFNVPDFYLPQWGAGSSYDGYQSGKPTYDWGNREFVQAASAARIYLTGLVFYPRHLAINIWVSNPFMDHDLTPLLLCKMVNTLGHHFPDVRYLGRADPAAKVRAYVFTRLTDGKGVAAIWTHDADVENGFKRGPRLSFVLPSGTAVYDFTGVRRGGTRATGGAVSLDITPAPLILEASSADALLKALTDRHDVRR